MLKVIKKRALKALGLALIIGAGGLMFQNCGTYQAGTAGVDLSTTCDITPTLCGTTVLDEGILMTIGNPNITLMNAQSTFDVAGYCDNGSYDGTQSKLQFKILFGNNTNTTNCNSSDPDGACWNNAVDSSGAASRCVNGRFNFSVVNSVGSIGGLPVHTSGVATLFILEVRLAEVDPSNPGVTITNGVGRATQTINIYISTN